MIRGQYQLLEKIGAGGMGEVYQARDTKLNRLVAIKILRGDSNADASRQRRFLQEAQAASALNHPNIITIYDVVSEDGAEVMVMEYVAGKTLDSLIPKGGLRLPTVLQYAIQMADALKTAHAAGIVHRDLKPANIMVTEQERVKILDFGLAKLSFSTEAPEPGDDPDATVLAPLTIAGTIMGTVCYMSPEQAQGKPVDARSDIFSFGAVLYEMATGERAFSGDNMATMLSSVLRDEPRRIMDLSPGMPAELDEVVRLCLAKEVEDRWKSMEVVQQVLTRLKQVSDSGQPFRSQQPGFVPPPPASATPSGIHPPPGPQSGIGIPPAAAIPPGKGLKLSRKGWFLVGGLALALATCWNNSEPKVKVSRRIDPGEILKIEMTDTFNNSKVIKLVKAKASPKLIIDQIRASEDTDFDLSTDAVIKLVKEGVPEEVIAVMRDPEARTKVEPPSKSVKGVVPGAPPAPVVPGVPAAASKGPVVEKVVTIPDGLPMNLRLDLDIPVAADNGFILRFLVQDDLKVGEDVVVAKGAAATGEIVLERRRGKVFGGGGQRLSFRLKDVEASDGQKLPIRNTPSQRGPDAPLRPVDALSRQKGMELGKEMAAMKDSAFPAYIAGEQTLRLKK